jgi:hypothetical protein
MKTIKTIKTAADIASLNLGNEYTIKGLTDSLTLATSLAELCPSLPIALEYDSDNIGHGTIWLDKSKLIIIRKDSYRGSYSIYSSKFYPSISYDKQNDILSTLKEPKGFKVPTARKILDWYAYTLQAESLLQQAEIDNAVKHTEYLARIDQAGKLEGVKLILNSSSTGGWLESENVDLSFTLDQNGYVNESLRLKGSLNLDTFLKLNF